MIYLYDGFKYRTPSYGDSQFDTYFFEKNLQGDIVAIYNEAGTKIGTYTYDAWGNCTITSNTTGYNFILYNNPFRYRGYYYDTETGFYYLQSRYYNPTWGRFINADGYVSTGQGMLGYNMFAYCGNNPVSRIDNTGHSWGEIWGFIQTAFSEIVGAMGTMTPAYAGCVGAAVADGPLPYGDVVAIAGVSLLTVCAVGYGIYQAAQAPAVSIPKAEEKAEVIPAPPPTPTVIYRYGGTNPGNLTPSQRDVDLYPITGKGLSFSTVPRPGAAMTTIEALNATGVVYAVCDGVGHVSVHPIGGTLEDWHNAGSSSVWTTAVKSVVVKWDGGELK